MPGMSMARVGLKVRARLLLPARSYWLAWVAVCSSLLLSFVAGQLGSDVGGLAEQDSPAAMCRALANPDPPASTSCAHCQEQRTARLKKIERVRQALRVACKRHKRFERSLRKGAPEARRALLEEHAEIDAQYRKLRQLSGPERDAESSTSLLNLAVTCALGLGALYGFGWHARRVGIQRCHSLRELKRPLLLSGGATLLVASVVTGFESWDIEKTSFDWSSLCSSTSAFVVNHAVQLPVAVLIAVQLSAGFYAMKSTHTPAPNAQRPGWGLRPYVTFLETWCVLIVVMMGGVAALWLHGLALDPSRTNVIVSFMGWGALGSTLALLGRIMNTARKLRDRCEELAFPLAHAPDDPTEGLLGKAWWQVPSVFAAAGGVAWWLLEHAGAGHLYVPGP